MGLGVLPSRPSPRLPVPPVITGTPSPQAHTHTHTRVHTPASISIGRAATRWPSQDHCPGSCRSLPSPLFWMPGLQPLGLWSSHLPQPRVTKQVHFLHREATLWNKCPFFATLSMQADQPWKRLRDMWFGPGPSKLVANQALPSRLPLPGPSCGLSSAASGGLSSPQPCLLGGLGSPGNSLSPGLLGWLWARPKV